MIEIKNFTKSYKKDKKIIDNLSLTVDDGCIFGIILLLVITIFISFNKSLLINYLSNFYNNDVVQVINNNL